jgi:hypothetical protein
MTSIANDPEFQRLADALGTAALDAGVCGGDFGSSGRFAAAEGDLVAYIDNILELRVVAAANVVNNALALQHDRITRMDSALREIKRAAGHGSPMAWSVVLDLAEAGLRVVPSP